MSKKTTTHSPDYDYWAAKYARRGVKISTLRRLVALGVLTAEEFTEITGEDYVEPEG